MTADEQSKHVKYLKPLLPIVVLPNQPKPTFQEDKMNIFELLEELTPEKKRAGPGGPDRVLIPQTGLHPEPTHQEPQDEERLGNLQAPQRGASFSKDH